MSTRGDDGKRRLVPRWRYTRRTILGREHEGDPRVKRPLIRTTSNLPELSEAWVRSRSIAAARDLVTAAVVDANPEVAREAAEYLLKRVPAATPEVLGSARFVLGERAMSDAGTHVPGGTAFEQGFRQARHVIAAGRQGLRDYPRNVARRLDVARAYAVLGKREAALRQMRIALALAPDHRVVLRVAARLFLHVGLQEEAHALLVKHPRTREDPWLMATEIALAAILEKAPHSASSGRILITESGLAPGHLSELASALATFDAMNGDTKRARKLYRVSLEDPNDNVLAQAHWLAQFDSSLRGRLAEARIRLRGSMEAECFHALAQGRWRDALAHAYEWHHDEPFSSRPATAASFIAETPLRDYPAAIEIARVGLQADPGDEILLNNLIVALARNGNLDDAAGRLKELSSRSRTRIQEYIYVATRGLVAYARGDYSGGRADYMAALRLAPSAENRLQVLVSWGETEARHHTVFADLLYSRLRAIKRQILDVTTRSIIAGFEETYTQAKIAGAKPRQSIGAPDVNLGLLMSEVE